MEKTEAPTTLAPELCIEILSATNTVEEMDVKRGLYLNAGAEEIWLVTEEGEIRFFGEEEMKRSEIAPNCPDHL